MFIFTRFHSRPSLQTLHRGKSGRRYTEKAGERVNFSYVGLQDSLVSRAKSSCTESTWHRSAGPRDCSIEVDNSEFTEDLVDQKE